MTLGIRSASSPQLPDDCSFTFEMYTTSVAYDGILRKQSIEVSGEWKQMWQRLTVNITFNTGLSVDHDW